MRPFSRTTMLWSRTATSILRNTSLAPIPFLRTYPSRLYSYSAQRSTQSPKVYNVSQGEETLLPSEPSPPPSRNRQTSQEKKLYGSKSYGRRYVEWIRPFEAKPKRALFYVPGSSQKMIDKAWTLDVDNIVYAIGWRSVDYRLLI
jgi:hypothetical protein